MLDQLKKFKFYLKYYLTNHWVGHIPIHSFRLWWYRRIMHIKIGRRTNIQLGTLFYGNTIHEISIGDNVIIPPRCIFNASAPIILEDNIHLGHGVEFHTSRHDPDSDNHAGSFEPIRIKKHVAIGTRSIILSGVTLEEGVLVTVGSVVSRSVEPFTIVGGIPARPICKRNPNAKMPPPDIHPPLFC